MASSKTFKGSPKPYGKPGHYDEPTRHALQAKGIHTGHLADSQLPLILDTKKSKWYYKDSDFKAIVNRIPTLERKKEFIRQFNNLTLHDQRFLVSTLKDTDKDKAIDLYDCNPYDPTQQDLKEFVSTAAQKVKEAAQKGAEWVKKEIPIVKEKLQEVGQKISEGAEDLRARLTAPADQEITIEQPEVAPVGPEAEFETEAEMPPEEPEIEQPEAEVESRSETYEEPRQSIRERLSKAKTLYKEAYSREKARKLAEIEGEPLPEAVSGPFPANLGTFLADLDQDYSSEELAPLSDKEIELLAVRYDTQFKDSGLLAEPNNPFVEELRKRIAAQKRLIKIKRKIHEEIEKPPQKEPGIFDAIFE